MIFKKITKKTFTSVMLAIMVSAMKKYQKSQPRQKEVNINIKVQQRNGQTHAEITINNFK